MIEVRTLETPTLGNRSYLVTDGTTAVVIDPQRYIDRMLELSNGQAVSITHVIETHIHNDYVTGGLELAFKTGATYVLPVDTKAEFDHKTLADGDSVKSGTMTVRAISTPGHTHHHTSYLVSGGDSEETYVFTGGSMLYGATGRTNLVSPDDTNGLTHAQFHSVNRLADELPGATQVYPTHGFGSFCSATPTSGTSSTVEAQKSVNPALTLAEQEFVDTLLAGLDAYPAYYAHMGPFNRSGPSPVDLSAPRAADADEIRARLERGEWVVDLRDRRVFASGHIEGTRNFELGTNFITYLGWLYTYGTELTLIGESQEQIDNARRELVRIGIDELSGAGVGAIEELSGGRPLRSYSMSDFAGLASRQQQGDVAIVDARRNGEREAGYIKGSVHIPLHELEERIDEVRDGEVWVYCGSGYRGSIAASILDKPGLAVTVVNDSFDNAKAARLTA